MAMVIARSAGNVAEAERMSPRVATSYATLALTISGGLGGATVATALNLSSQSLFEASAATLRVPRQDVALVSLGAISIVIATWSLTGKGPWQIDRETPYRWLSTGGVFPSVLNGLTLGMAWPTRIGFWSLYCAGIVVMIPTSPLVAASLGLMYGVARLGLSVGAMMWTSSRGAHDDPMALAKMAVARRIDTIVVPAVGVSILLSAFVAVLD